MLELAVSSFALADPEVVLLEVGVDVLVEVAPLVVAAAGIEAVKTLAVVVALVDAAGFASKGVVVVAVFSAFVFAALVCVLPEVDAAGMAAVTVLESEPVMVDLAVAVEAPSFEVAAAG